MHDFKNWYRSMNRREREEFAARAGTSRRYIENALVFRRRMPHRSTMERLAEASLGRMTYPDLVAWFLLQERGAP